MSKISEAAVKQTINVLLTLPNGLDEKLQVEAKAQERKRHAQIIFILQKFFETPNGRGTKEKGK
ncbi:MAG: hypothetical protein M3Q33_01410 [Acidobacteriota bacterium]|nr:hypothetical protein [Acidobacteriota bacterium]